jgi:hypothetical protein
MDDSISISRSLALQAAWFVADVKLDTEADQVHIHVEHAEVVIATSSDRRECLTGLPRGRLVPEPVRASAAAGKHYLTVQY